MRPPLAGEMGVSSREPGRGRKYRRRPRAAAIAPLVEAMGPPISAVPWSPQVVAQTLEIFAVGLRGGALFWLKPLHAESLRVGLPIAAKPGEVVLDVMTWYPLVPRVVHSTSWRQEESRMILTYIAVVEPPDRLPPHSLVELPVARTELARGDAMGPPKAIAVAAVIEHALRHLSWLIRDDLAIAEALADWATILAPYQPEPFRSLG